MSIEQMKEQTSQTNWSKLQTALDQQMSVDKDAPDVSEMLHKKEVKKVGRPRQTITKALISLRLDAEVLDKLRATGKGWQTRLNEYIEKGLKQGKI